jgi:hypothetical protein
VQTLVYSEVKRQIKDAALALVQRERDGEHVDRALLKDVLGIFVEMGGNSDLSCYEADLEEALLKVRFQSCVNLGTQPTPPLSPLSPPQPSLTQLSRPHCRKRRPSTRARRRCGSRRTVAPSTCSKQRSA